MSKKTITFFVLTTILVIVGAIGYGFYLDGVISKNLSNPLSESANNSPYIPYIYVTSGLLSKSLTKNYSNGVIPKFTDAIPVDSYSFSQKPIVIPGDQRVVVEVMAKTNKFGDVEVSLTLDGQIYVTLQRGDKIAACINEKTVKFLRRKQETFYGTLRSKLHWGEAPRE